MIINISKYIILFKRLLLAPFILSVSLFSCKAQSLQPSLFIQAPNSPIKVKCEPGNILTGDFNEDKKPDFVITCGLDTSLTVFIGRGNGQFDATASGRVLLPDPPGEIVTGDINLDGHADLLVASHDSYGITILHGDGKGNFTVSANSPVMMKVGNHPHTHGLGIGDLNEDGYPDIVTANNADNDISIVLNDGRGGFIPCPGSPIMVSDGPYPLTVGDVNRDGHLDIVSTSTMFGNRKDPHVLSLLTGNGKGGFKRSDIPVRTSSPWFVAIGDINKDNMPDLIATHGERNELTVLLNDNNRFIEADGSPFNLGSHGWHIALSDVNDDSYPDVLAAADNGIRVLSGDGRGQFKPVKGSPFLTGKGVWRLAVSDVNGDGKPDVLNSNLESSTVSVLLRR